MRAECDARAAPKLGRAAHNRRHSTSLTALPDPPPPPPPWCASAGASQQDGWAWVSGSAERHGEGESTTLEAYGLADFVLHTIR